MADESIRVYFSFRSPYAWLGVHRIGRALDSLPVELDWIPVFPPPDMPNNPTNNPLKVVYIQRDVERTAESYGLPVKWPPAIDVDWYRPHAAFLHAKDRGLGEAFAARLFAARFQQGLDCSTDETLSSAAAAADLEPEAVLAAARDEALHKRVDEGMRRGLGEDGLFGVPLFIYRGEPFWGNDRIEGLVRAVRRGAGVPQDDAIEASLSRFA